MDTYTFAKLYNGYATTSQKEIEILEELLKEEIVKFEDDKYSLNSKYKIGTIKIKKNFATFTDISNNITSLTIEFKNLQGAFSDDLVVIKRAFNPRQANLSKVVKILNSNLKEALLYVDSQELFTVKEGIKVEQNIKNNYKNGDIFLYDFENSKIVEFFGNIEDAKIDEKISLFLYDEFYRIEQNKEFNTDTLNLDDCSNRVDLQHLPFCTIDPNSAKDHDDAIYYDSKNSTLYVAIADVSHFVKEGTLLDELAFKKSTSIYFPNKVFPMLPAILSEELCSLKENQIRFAYVFKIVLDIHNMCVANSEYFEAVIKSHKNLSYGRVDRVLENKFDQCTNLERDIFISLIEFYEVVKQFRNNRLQNGYDFRSIKYKQHLENNQELQSVTLEESSSSHKLVEEAMLLANIEASKALNEVGIYRVHDEPSFDNVSKLVDLVNSIGVEAKLEDNIRDTILSLQNRAKISIFTQEIDELIIKTQTQAFYSPKNLGHFGLGFSSYSHFTSPIRRYSDLVLHRILKSKNTPKNIDEICEHISQTQRKVDQLVWDFEDRKYARWAKKNINIEFKAYIIDEQKAIAKIYENMQGVRVFLDNYKAQTLFSKIKIIIKDVDIISKKITASIKY